jgi:5-methylcytosine-specific restriction protein A
MPYKPIGPCRVRGCPGRATHHGYCVDHAGQAVRGTSSQRGYGAAWQAHLQAEPYCRICYAHGQLTQAAVVHHIIPLNQGGTSESVNLASLCHSCHASQAGHGYKGGHTALWGVETRRR